MGVKSDKKEDALEQYNSIRQRNRSFRLHSHELLSREVRACGPGRRRKVPCYTRATVFVNRRLDKLLESHDNQANRDAKRLTWFR